MERPLYNYIYYIMYSARLLCSSAKCLVKVDGAAYDVVVVGHFVKLCAKQAALCGEHLQIVGA